MATMMVAAPAPQPHVAEASGRAQHDRPRGLSAEEFRSAMRARGFVELHEDDIVIFTSPTRHGPASQLILHRETLRDELVLELVFDSVKTAMSTGSGSEAAASA